MTERKIVAFLLFTALVFVAVVQVCKPMQMLCGSACTGRTSISSSAVAMEMRSTTDVNAPCTEQNGGCSAANGDASHMATFSSVFPSVSTNLFNLTVFTGILLAVSFLALLGSISSIHESVRMVRVKSHIRKVADALRANILRFILSQGILQPKIYA